MKPTDNPTRGGSWFWSYNKDKKLRRQQRRMRAREARREIKEQLA